MKSNKKLIALVCTLLLMVGAAGATLAWLTDTTETVTNTFTTSDINIELTESENLDLQMVPGFTIEKDPIVTVKADSEDCWVFIKVQESENLDDYIEYKIDTNNWTELEDGIYYCYAKDIKDDRSIKVLLNNQVTVKGTVTKADMEALAEDGATQPELSFKAFAVQLYKSNGVEFTPAEAWANIPADEK